MVSYKEYLENYTKNEKERMDKFIKNYSNGKTDEIYPPKDRFIKLNDPIAATPFNCNPWALIPFYGSTLLPLLPRNTKKQFDEACNEAKLGFDSSNIDRLIDFAKDTGRIQFIIVANAEEYANLDFLEGLFNTLNPPMIPDIRRIKLGNKVDEYFNEFYQIKNISNLTTKIKKEYDENISEKYYYKRLDDIVFYYSYLKYLGYHEITDKIKKNISSNNIDYALDLLFAFGNLIAMPEYSILKEIRSYPHEFLSQVANYGKNIHFNLDHYNEDYSMPYDIGKYIVEKLVKYPHNLDGCQDIIQEYEDEELLKVFKALNEGIRSFNIDLANTKIEEYQQILDLVWGDTERIKTLSRLIYSGVLSMGVIGEMIFQLKGAGILSGAGFLLDNLIQDKLKDGAKSVSKSLMPNHLVTIFNFQENHQRHL